MRWDIQATQTNKITKTPQRQSQRKAATRLSQCITNFLSTGITRFGSLFIVAHLRDAAGN